MEKERWQPCGSNSLSSDLHNQLNRVRKCAQRPACRGNPENASTSETNMVSTAWFDRATSAKAWQVAFVVLTGLLLAGSTANAAPVFRRALHAKSRVSVSWSGESDVQCASVSGRTNANVSRQHCSNSCCMRHVLPPAADTCSSPTAIQESEP